MYNTKTPQVKQLSPSLAEIENYLFAPSFGLCQLVYNNDPSINVNIANGIKNSVAYKILLKLWKNKIPREVTKIF